MEQLSLTVFELIYLGNLMGRYLHAVPDIYSQFSADDAAEFRQGAMDSLLAKGFIKMDLDGEITISPPVLRFVQFCAECNGYVLVSKKGSTFARDDIILWRMQSTFMCATLQDMDYQFEMVPPSAAADRIHELWRQTYPETAYRGSAQIPQVLLKKVKRLLDQNEYDAAVHLLLRSGLNGDFSRIVLDAMSDPSDFYSILFVDMTGENANTSSFIFSFGRYGCLRMFPAVDGYRSSAVFTLTSPKKIKAAIQNETEIFARIKEM